MSSKIDTEVIIDGKIFTLSGYETEDYLQKVANYINNKIAEMKKDEGYKTLPADYRSLLLNLNIADDYFKARKTAESIETDTEVKDKQLYDVKHELVAAQVKADALERELEEYKKKLDEAQKENIKLEARLFEIKEGSQTKSKKSTSKKSAE